MNLFNDKDKLIDLLIQRVNDRINGFASRQATSIPQMRYSRIFDTSGSINCFYEPCIVCVLQGNKKSMVGNKEFDYGKGSTLYIGIDMPSNYHFYNITKDKPFITISFDINTEIIKQILNDMEMTANYDSNAFDSYGVSLDSMDHKVLEVLLRLTELESDNDSNAKKILLNPFLTEFYYYIIRSRHGSHIKAFYNKFAAQSAIYKVINYLKLHYKENEDIEQIAAEVAFMQPSTFFKHFKAVTGISPLQYKKRMRLMEAKKLIEVEHREISQSAFMVGYESVSQFSREFKALFKDTPSSLRAVKSIQI